MMIGGSFCKYTSCTRRGARSASAAADMAANGIEGAMNDDLTEGFLQVRLNDTGQALVVGDQGETVACHGASPSCPRGQGDDPRRHRRASPVRRGAQG